MVDSSTMMEMGFNIIYLTFILGIILYMRLHLKSVKAEQAPLAHRFLLGFMLLFVGDIAHVGLRFYLIATDSMGKYPLIEAIGTIFELLSMYCLIICLITIWIKRFEKTVDAVSIGLIGLCIIGMITVLLPQNEWSSVNPPTIWSSIRIIPWTFVGIFTAFLYIQDGRVQNDKMFKKIGFVLLPSVICYSSPALFPNSIPGMLIGIIMIIGTIFFMIMEYAPVKEYYLKKATPD
jgi:hypothetical protein